MWRINLFIYNLFISEIHSPFSKKSEDDLCDWVLITENQVINNLFMHF